MTTCSKIILLGTVHQDPMGFRRLGQSLLTIRPDLILVELSPYALKFRQEFQQSLHKTLLFHLKEASQKRGLSLKEALTHSGITAIGRQISLPFEYRAAASFRKVSGTEVCPVDYSDFSRQWIDTWHELLSVENLSTLLSLPSTPAPISQTYDLAARRIREDTPAQGWDSLTRSGAPAQLWAQREKYMAERILKLLDAFSPERPLYVGGWWHLTKGGSTPTLRNLLGVKRLQCLLLDRGVVV